MKEIKSEIYVKESKMKKTNKVTFFIFKERQTEKQTWTTMKATPPTLRRLHCPLSASFWLRHLMEE
jgi:hypothetical protein